MKEQKAKRNGNSRQTDRLCHFLSWQQYHQFEPFHPHLREEKKREKEKYRRERERNVENKRDTRQEEKEIERVKERILLIVKTVASVIESPKEGTTTLMLAKKRRWELQRDKLREEVRKRREYKAERKRERERGRREKRERER
jgi:hypothetical protein